MHARAMAVTIVCVAVIAAVVLILAFWLSGHRTNSCEPNYSANAQRYVLFRWVTALAVRLDACFIVLYTQVN